MILPLLVLGIDGEADQVRPAIGPIPVRTRPRNSRSSAGVASPLSIRMTQPEIPCPLMSCE